MAPGSDLLPHIGHHFHEARQADLHPEVGLAPAPRAVEIPGRSQSVALEMRVPAGNPGCLVTKDVARSEEHTSELQSLMRISYAVFCLKKKNEIERQLTVPTSSTNN